MFLGAFFIISNENLRINNSENIDIFFKHYFKWIDSLGSNSVRIAGEVVKMEWIPNGDK